MRQLFSRVCVFAALTAKRRFSVCARGVILGGDFILGPRGKIGSDEVRLALAHSAPVFARGNVEWVIHV